VVPHGREMTTLERFRGGAKAQSKSNCFLATLKRCFPLLKQREATRQLKGTTFRLPVITAKQLRSVSLGLRQTFSSQQKFTLSNQSNCQQKLRSLSFVCHGLPG
jgi:hypothetical protein